MIDDRQNFYNEEEEINLYDVLEIFNKYKKMIFRILILGFVLSFAAAFIARGFRKETASQEYQLDYAPLENSAYYKMIEMNFPKFDPDRILKSEAYIDRFLEIPELKVQYEKLKSEEENLIVDRKIKFINKMISVKKENDIYIVTVKTDKSLKVSKKILELYFVILQEEIPGRIQQRMLEQKERSLLVNASATEKLNVIKEQVANVLGPNFRSISVENAEFTFGLRYPLLMTDREIQQSLYDKSSKQILGIDEVLSSHLLDQIIQLRSSLTVSNASSMAKIVLAVGMIFTFAFSFFMVLYFEFMAGYKKYKKEKKLTYKKD